MLKLAEKDLCTGCGACAFVCPKSCIQMEEDDIYVIYPRIDASKCIDCKRCQKVCPILNPIMGYKPQKAYAAWSANAEERRTSASGGIAAEVYKEALKEGYAVVGAVQSNNDFSVVLDLTMRQEELALFKNSKYVFSTAYGLFPKLKEALVCHQKTVVIGLPCQIAAIRKIFKDSPELLLMDVVCHGTTPYEYLRQHICNLEVKNGQIAKRMSFRDPDAYTYTYTFTLYDSEGQQFYAKRTKDGDTYQYGFHRSVSYRESCFHCTYAREERLSDVTLSDYSGLGKLAPCSYTARNVSCILVHTDKGQDFINRLIREKKIIAEERPVREPILGDERLRQPTKKKSVRRDFEKYIIKYNGDFERAMSKIMPNAIRRDRMMQLLYLPERIVNKIIKIIKQSI